MSFNEAWAGRPGGKPATESSHHTPGSAVTWAEQLNDVVAETAAGRYFKLNERRTTFITELRAGTVAFLASAYILAVNANILTETGGTCSYTDCTGADRSPACVFTKDPGYQACLVELKTSFITATAASATVACFFMGVVANLPLTVAPAMGVNAFFAFTVVGFRGNKNVSYQEAMAGVFIEGWVFLILAVTGMKTKLIYLIPRTIMLATAGGIGMFLAVIGYSSSAGLGLIAASGDNYVTLGGCDLNHQVPQYAIKNTSAVCSTEPGGSTQFPPGSLVYQCDGGVMRSPTLWLGLAGGAIMVFLLCRQVKGAMMVGILFVTIISWIYVPGNRAAYLGPYSAIAGGEQRLEYFRQVVDVPDARPTLVAWDWGGFGKLELWLAILTWLYINLLDVTGTLFSMATFINSNQPGFVDEEQGTFPGHLLAYIVNGGAIIIGAIFGTPPLTIYIESATGIKEGGRTGMSAITTSFFFFLALWLAPILASIPPYATGSALVLVGALMMENCMRIAWQDPMQAIPAFLTITLMPFTFSVTNGIIAGLGSYLLLHGLTFLLELGSVLICGKGGGASDAGSVAGESEAGSVHQVQRTSTGHRSAASP